MKKTIIALSMMLMGFSQQAFAQFGFGGNQQSESQAQFSEKYADINYVGDGQAYHTLDVYLPKTVAPAEGYPVIVHIYGSAWFSNNSKGMADINTICARLLDAGYAIVTPNHRSSGDAKYPAQINDIKAAIRWVRGNAEKYHFNKNFIGTSGFSSGAHLASLCATTNGVKEAVKGNAKYDIEGNLGQYTQESSDVFACCEWSGPIDLMNMDCDGVPKTGMKPEDALMGFAFPGHENEYDLLSPVYFIGANKANIVPIRVNHGLKDNVVPSCQGKELFEVLQANNIAGCSSHFEPEGGHGFNMYNKENLDAMVKHFEDAKNTQKQQSVKGKSNKTAKAKKGKKSRK